MKPGLGELSEALTILAWELEKASYDDTTAEQCAILQEAMHKVQEACGLVASLSLDPSDLR